jgi:hypothetical protein
VGILAATLIDPILLAAIQQRHDTAVWMLGSTLLIVVRWPAWMVTLLVVLGSIGVQALV